MQNLVSARFITGIDHRLLLQKNVLITGGGDEYGHEKNYNKHPLTRLEFLTIAKIYISQFRVPSKDRQK